MSLKNLLTGGVSDLVRSVGDAVDKNTTTKAERLEIERLAARDAYDAARAERADYLQDTQNARAAGVAVQQSPNASWLAKNIKEILALLVVLPLVVLMLAPVFLQLTSEQALTLQNSVSALMVIAMIVFQYNYGSSKGSADKNELLARGLKR